MKEGDTPAGNTPPGKNGGDHSTMHRFLQPKPLFFAGPTHVTIQLPPAGRLLKKALQKLFGKT
ncbi:hypothetical protein [Desulfoluna butyratoxydans]|uniref:hypothetical protein n=1 Tax=Desulfoluna butyratoxydans TaxID=231438 RepID=UPI0015D3E323|nr:hypothetical protein [Desulfoluna butyratoxydans]